VKPYPEGVARKVYFALALSVAVLTSITLVRGRWYYSHGQLIAGPVSLIDLQQMIEQANRPRTSQFTPQKSELLTQRAPSVATGKAIDAIA